MLKFGLYVVFILTASLAAARADDERPPEIKAYLNSQKPYGKGTYSFLFDDLYEATLWTDASTWSWQTPFALTLRYDIHVTSKRLIEKSIEEMNEESALSKAEMELYTNTLLPIFPDIKPGDQITALYTPRKALRFFYNGKPMGIIKDTALAKRFIGIWLSERTSAPDLRDQLLFVHNT